MDKIETPCFLVGSVRSGSTMLRLLLDHHPRIAFNLESEFIVSQIKPDGAFPDMARYRDWLSKDRVFQHSRFAVDPSLGFEELVNDFLHQKMVRDGKEIVGATVHEHYSWLPLIWPNARYIYLYRDPRDVSNSIVQMGWAGNAFAASEYWLRAEDEWDKVCSRVPESRRIEVKYERLVAEPRAELGRICDFLGVDYSDRMYEYEETTGYKRPDTQLVRQWKKRTREIDVRLLEARVGNRLLTRGYELSGYRSIELSRTRRGYHNLRSRVGRFMWRTRKYGLPLVAQEVLSRRMGLRGINANCRKRIDAIIDANLR